jgi:hypothetical protein
VWIEENQFGRRNLPPFVRVELALVMELPRKKKAAANLATAKPVVRGGSPSQISAKAIDRYRELGKRGGSATTCKAHHCHGQALANAARCGRTARVMAAAALIGEAFDPSPEPPAPRRLHSARNRAFHSRGSRRPTRHALSQLHNRVSRRYPAG